MLPRERIVEAAAARIGMVHIPGPRLGRAERLVARFPGCGAVVYGHTHAPDLEQAGSVWLLNPGSPTDRRRAPVRTMLELSVEEGELHPRLIDLGP
jgi:putative phosphoesterase